VVGPDRARALFDRALIVVDTARTSQAQLTAVFCSILLRGSRDRQLNSKARPPHKKEKNHEKQNDVDVIAKERVESSSTDI
jgi:hypothetical protein